MRNNAHLFRNQPIEIWTRQRPFYYTFGGEDTVFQFNTWVQESIKAAGRVYDRTRFSDQQWELIVSSMLVHSAARLIHGLRGNADDSATNEINWIFGKKRRKMVTA